MKLAELKELKGEALLNAAIVLHKELDELKNKSVPKGKYEKTLGELTTLKQSGKDLKAELSNLKETTVSKEFFDQKINNLIQEKKVLESQVKENTVASVEKNSEQTHFLVPGMLGQNMLDLICRSLNEKFIGESDITIFGNADTPLVEALEQALKEEKIPDEFVLITEPCVAINPFSLVDIKYLRCKKNGDFNTGLPFVLEREKLNALDDFDSIEELINAYHAKHFEDQVPMLLLDVGPDNLKCGVYRTNPRIDLVEKALISKKFYCFNDKGLQALQPIFDELYPKSDKEE